MFFLRKLIFHFAGFVVAVLLFITDLSLGSVNLPFSDIFSMFLGDDISNKAWQLIFSEYRLPKAITAVLAGSALSVSGLMMQIIFRNPLAGPYILGISAGASLGVAFSFMGAGLLSTLGIIVELGYWGSVASACLGASFVLILILFVSMRIKDMMTVLVLGIMFGSIVSSVVGVLQYFSDEVTLKSYVIWSMGSLSDVSSENINILTAVVSFGLFVSFLSGKSLNALLLGENYAKTLGLNMFYIRTLVFFGTSILAGSITAFCGPIGFVGIVVPHISRMLLKTSDTKHLIIFSILAGSVFMLLCDVLSQLPGSNKVLPINSVSAFIGVPFIIYIIMRNRKISGF